MIANISSLARFHAFDLALQMERLGCLGRLYTAYPRSRVGGLPAAKVASFPWAFVPSAALGRLGWHQMRQWLDWPAIESFDRWLAAHVAPCDVFHCLSSFGLRGHRTANSRYGAVTVCDRGSSHIVYQDEVLAEEYERHRTAYRPINPRVVEKELQEYEECDLITVPSSFVLRTFVAKGVPENKLAKLSYGVDLRLFRPVPKEDAVFRAVYAGSLMLQKGVPYLLDALATLRLPDFDLLLIGGMTEEIRPFLARHAGGFHYAGFIHRTELFRWFSQGSVFVIASIQEGLALVMAQAMACGLPVIATTNTGAEDLITDGVEGFIVPPRDPQAIREKVLLLYEQPELRAEMGQAALRRVKCLGGWDQYGDRAAHVYADAIARKHGSRIA